MFLTTTCIFAASSNLAICNSETFMETRFIGPVDVTGLILIKGIEKIGMSHLLEAL